MESRWLSKFDRFSRPEEAPPLDRGMLIGAGVCAILILAGITIGGSGLTFLNPESFVLVVGGVIGATCVQYSLNDLRYAMRAFQNILLEKEYRPTDRIVYLVQLAQRVRRDGLLVLESEAREQDDPFLRMALDLAVDAQEGHDVRRILETEMRSANDRSLRAIQVFESMGTYAPAMGLIGTLIGLVQMLNHLEDPATVGPAMAIALITTLYGAVLSNMVFLPISGKIKNRAEESASVKALTIEGIVGLGKQENPVVIEQRLQSYAPMAPAA